MHKLLLHGLLLIGFYSFVGVGSVFAGYFEDYQRDLDIYRTLHDQFVVKKNQYAQIRTFAVEEELITSAREMLLSRADVWSSYWDLMYTKILALRDLPGDKKEYWRTRFKDETTFLKDHKARLVAAKTRTELMDEASSVNALAEMYYETAFSANSQVAVGAMTQSVTDLLTFNKALADRVTAQLFTSSEKEIKLRGLSVQTERVSGLLGQLFQLQTKFDESSGYATTESFSKITRELEAPYSELLHQSQIVAELSEGVEW